MKLRITVFLGLAYLSGFGQSATSPTLAPGYYVVVASYLNNQENFASAYAARLNTEGKHAAIGFDPVRKFHHVYLDAYAGFDESIQQMLKARGAGFSTAWVRIIKGIPGQETSAPVVKKEAPVAPAVKTEKAPAEKVVAEKKPELTAKDTTNANKATVVENKTVATNTAAAAVPEGPTLDNNDPMIHPEVLKTNTTLFTLYNPTNNTQVEGDVEIIDADRNRLIVKDKGNDYALLPDPQSRTEKLGLNATSFGYRPVKLTIKYNMTEKDSLPEFMDVLDNHYRIKFDMVRLRRGDIAVLYNVYFYNDAAIMLPDSKYELQKLLTMMNDNVGYRIKLHGHTNGSAPGKIVTMGESKDFFNINELSKQGFGTAKALSRSRAEIIRDWLIANGIDGKRIQVQAHGGSRMIHDKNSISAKRNVRVEVEMLDE